MPETVRCPSCDKEASSNHSFCEYCGATVKPAVLAQTSVPAMQPSHATEQIAQMMYRYTDGYRYARAIDGLGIFIQMIAYIVGGIIVVHGISGFSEAPEPGPFNSGSNVASVLQILLGLLLGTLGYIHGVIVRAAGQALKAHFDCAIFQSPFLSNAQRAAVLFPK